MKNGGLLLSKEQKYNLKPIHNIAQFVAREQIAVEQRTKIQSETNSQPKSDK